MGPVWCTGTVEREKLLESYNGYVALVGARSGSDSGLSVLPLGEWIGEFATGLCDSDAGGFLSSGSDAAFRARVLSESGCVDGGVESDECEHESDVLPGGNKLVRGGSVRLDERFGVLKGPSGGFSVGRGSKYERNQRNRERRKARAVVEKPSAERLTTVVGVLSDEEHEARRSLAEVWQIKNKLKLMSLKKKLAEEEEGLSSQTLVQERKKLEEQCRLVAARQKLTDAESRVAEGASCVKSAKSSGSSGGVAVKRQGTPGSSVSDRERVLEKQVAALTEEVAALRFQLKSSSTSGESGVSEREVALERRSEELEKEVVRLRSDKQLIDAGAQRKVYYKERDKVYKQFLEVTAENEKLKKQLAGSRGNSGSAAGPAVDVQALLQENAAMRKEVNEFRQQPVVKDGITERDISQLKMWGVEQVRVRRSWF